MSKKKNPHTDSRRKPGGGNLEESPQGHKGKRKVATFPIVGIGASAGGLAALKLFFSHVPKDSSLAYVVVVHLSPDHESHLAELLQPHVKIPVEQVTDTVELEKNRVYVIPPNANLDSIDTHLRLSELEEQRQERAPIDHFFRTLAKTHDGQSIGVILTGTGSDGTLGLREIKQSGGMTIVQDPNEAEYDGMPQSALSTGMVDLILPLAEIPEAITRFTRTDPKLPFAEERGDPDSELRPLLQRVFVQLRSRTGRDFSRYKRSTILRRIQRRMQLRQIEELSSYLDVLSQNPEEVSTLADDFLITVTSFFRDPEVFEGLEKEVIPRLFNRKVAEDEIRIWSVGCATGEEAYTLAMLLLEEAERRGIPPQIQVFASDLHEHSLKQAREGFYPGDIETDVSPNRLKRFFIKENGGYRIRKNVREMVVFSPHNLLGDPPFSRMDLITCRNLMIYIERDVQRDIIELFHYALKPAGYMVLGTSETVDASDLFRVEDKKSCIYQKRNLPSPETRLPVFPMIRNRPKGGAFRPLGVGEPMPYGTLHQHMRERYAPPSALVSPDDKVVHLSEDAGRYLTLPEGEVTSGIFNLVREELRFELRSLLRTAREQGATMQSRPIPLQLNGESVLVVLHVRPHQEPSQEGFVVVIFDERKPEEPVASPLMPSEQRSQSPTEKKSLSRERALEAELHLTQQRLQALIEEYETSQEEMKASNEELQSINEELRSTMEELETSKEELQSMNEELQTVNQENRHRMEELGQLSSDWQNLLTATDIATLFLDRELRILRFTPRVSELFNIRTTDRGRPLSDLTHNLGDHHLQGDAQQVLDRLGPIEREVGDAFGRLFLTRVMPYRTTSDHIEGVVLTFVDITDRKAAEDLLKEADRRKDEFLATLAHELRNPLAPICTALEVLRMAEDKTVIFENVYDTLQWQTQHLVRLIDDLLDVSRISRGKLKLQKSVILLCDVVEAAVEESQPLIDQAGHELTISLPEQPIYLEADPHRLAQVLSNLLNNAAKFTPQGGRIDLSVLREDGESLISVKDNGQGIPLEMQAHVFEIFSQVHDSTGTVSTGLGIGLSLVKSLVEIHGGTIELDSAGSGQGSEFRIRLPFLANPPEKIEQLASTEGKVIDQSERRVLVVDDNKPIRDLSKQMFEMLGHSVRTASDGEEALAVAEEFRPDIILMDLGMPNMDGCEAARRIRQEEWGKSIMLVALSGWGQEKDKQRSEVAGFDHHLVKPAAPADIKRLLASSAPNANQT